MYGIANSTIPAGQDDPTGNKHPSDMMALMPVNPARATRTNLSRGH
jgi:hypothetical protein